MQSAPTRSALRSRVCALLVLVAFAFGAGGCNPRLDDQVAIGAYEAEFPPQPVGTLAREGGDPLLADDEDPAALENPFPATPETRAHGSALFAVYCVPCHGPTGWGDGAVAPHLGVRVRNLQSERVAELTDGEIFTAIGEGSGSMLPLRGLVARDERWLIVHAVRALREGGGAGTPAPSGVPDATRGSSAETGAPPGAPRAAGP